MNKKNLFIFLVVSPAFAVILLMLQIYYAIFMWTYSGPEKTFEIVQGDTFSSINYRLAQEKIVYSSRIFHQFTKFQNKMTNFKAGVYEIKPGLTMDQTLLLLTSGKSITIKVTIPEGKNLFEIAQILKENGVISSQEDFVALAKNEKFVNSLGIKASRIEGYLYPDTYNFSPNSSPKTIIENMYSIFKSNIKTVDYTSSNFTLHEIITLASVVEKETGAKFERPMIAGVFLNRLKKNMRLQSDPTTIYGIYENYDGNLRKKDLLEKTPYNTYKISGLPVGPISNPGIESIKAILNPASHKYLYFVSKNDGTHIFSETYKMHNQAVEEWQKNRSKRAGKSWRDLKQ